MLQRSLDYTIRRATSNISQETCTVCACTCGLKFRPNGLSTEQKRFAHKYRRSPAVRRKEWRLEAQTLTPEEKITKERLEEREAQMYYEIFIKAKQAGVLETDPDTVIGFLYKFAEFAGDHRPIRGGVTAELRAFEELRTSMGVSQIDCEFISRLLLAADKKANNRYLGKRLLFVLSNAGSLGATMRIMNHALVSNKTHPGTLKSSEIVRARDHLKEVAGKGENYHATVLEGKIAYELGDKERAICLWTQAMDAAVAASEEAKKLNPLLRGMTKKRMPGSDISGLSTPWVELTSVYLNRHEYEKARWAVDIGCQQDDPTSHYSAALLEKKWSDEGQHIVTSGWLYHITKAAASLHPKAAHELGIFYATSGWKYLEDEPPDHVKPTPFDSYPPEVDRTTSEPSIWDKILAATGLDSSSPKESPTEQLFHTAGFPSTAEGRLFMAIRWLEVSAGYCYAPSFLLVARLHLDKTLWAQSNAPPEALTLSDKRYTYASRADHLAGKPIEPSQIAEPEQNAKQDDKEEGVPNPYYSPKAAYDWLRHVFLAQSAMHTRRTIVENASRKALSVRDEDDIVNEDSLPGWMSSNVKKWFRFPEVREMYMDDRRGRMYDDALDLDIHAEARRMCDEHEWDIYGDDGGLLYKHGLQARRGQVEAAAAAATGAR